MDDCSSGANFLYLNQEKHNLISHKTCSFAHYALEGRISKLNTGSLRT